MAVRASSFGSGRDTRSSSVCHNRSTSSARRRATRGPSAATRRGSSAACTRSAILRSSSSTERRVASVGWAVKTGRYSSRSRTEITSARSMLPSASASPIRPAAAARGPSAPLVSSCQRCSCSVTLTSWKYAVNARASSTAVASSTSLSRACNGPSSSSRARLRTRSTRASSSGPSCRVSASPSSPPSWRTEARRAACWESEATPPANCATSGDRRSAAIICSVVSASVSEVVIGPVWPARVTPTCHVREAVSPARCAATVRRGWRGSAPVRARGSGRRHR